MLQHFDSLKSSQENVRLDALTSIVGDCKNAGTNKELEAWKSFEYAVGRFVKGLQSQVTSTRLEFYSGLTTLLSLAVKVDAEAVLEIVDSTLKGNGDESKSERKLLKIARILSYGALIRAKCKANPNGTLPIHIAKRILKPIVDITVKKKSLRSLSTPFICTFLNMCPPGDLDADLLSDLQRLLAKQEEREDLDLNYLKIVLTAEHRNLTPALGVARDVQEIIKVLLAEADADDSEFLSLVFDHIRNCNLFEAFWKIFVPSLGPYHTELFCTCIAHSIKSGCPLSYILCEDVVHLALSIFKNHQLGKNAKNKALESFQAIVSWGEGCCLTPKERKSALKLLYKKQPNLLYDYKILVGVIRSHLQHLSNKEVDYLGGILLESVKSETDSARARICTIDLLLIISQLKKSSSSGNIEIAKSFFQLGFCKQDISNEEGKEIDENSGVLLEHCSSLFLKCLQKTTDAVFVSTVYEYVSSVVASTEGTYELQCPLDGQGKTLWDKSAKLLKKITDPMVKLITQVGSVQLVKTSEDFLAVFENWLELAKKIATKESPQEIIVFIVDQIASMDNPFCDYEAIFKRYAMEGKISEETVQSLADAIDISEDFEDDEFDDSDEDESEDDEDGVENEKINGDSNNQLFSINNVSGNEINGGSDSDATIDMDEATEEDLKRMDDALAGVFSAKKRVKEDARRETVKYMRVLTLVDALIGRYKEPPISVILILLMPLISSVKHNLSIKSNKGELNRTLATLKRLNKCRKFTGMEDVDSDVLSTMAKEIKDLMKKRVVPKEVKNILASSRNNLLNSSQGSENEEKTRNKKDKKKRRKKNKTPNSSQPSTANPSSATSEGALEAKKLKETKTSTESAAGSLDNLPSKRKANVGLMKKKAKLLRMEVLSEGLSVNE